MSQQTHSTNDEPADIRQRHAAPYPGLRPFQQRETELFFGRGEQIDDMLQRLETRRFLAVIGASGSGKSSLVRAGLLPALADGFLSGAQGDWWIATLRPGDDPYRAMAKSLLEVRDRHDDDKSEVSHVPYTVNDVEYTAATLRGSQTGLLTALHDLRVPDDAEVLVLVDQFEELFRFRRLQEQRARQQAERSGKAVEQVQEEAAAFVNLLLASARQSRRRIYVVLTMRSDYLGDCDAFLGLPEAINESQFLTPRMTRDQMRDSIEGPLEAFGLRQRDGDTDSDWEAGLVNAILNDVGSDPDQLPLMQHALMRTWQLADERRERSAKESPGDARRVPQLTLADYRTVGGFQSALSNHADQTLAGLLEAAADKTVAAERERIVRRMFCLLCDFEPGGRITRRPATLQELLDVTQAPWSEVRTVVAEFAAAGRNFVVVDAADLESLTPQNTLDISHEALLRQWSKLRDQWLPAELESAAFYERLADQARRWKADPKKAGLWDTPDLETAVKWRDDERPSEAWAVRYSPGFAACHEFLEASHVAQKRRLDKEAETEASLRQTSLFRFASVFLVMALGIGIVVSVRMWNLSIEADKQRKKAAVASKIAAKEARLARAQQCAAVSGSNLSRNPVLATILAAEALRGLDKSDEVPQSVEQALRDAVAQCTGRPLLGHSGDVDNVAFDPTEKWLATTAYEEILLWDTSKGTPDEMRPLKLPMFQDTDDEDRSERYERFVAVAFDPRGERLSALRSSGEYFEWLVGHAPRLVRRLNLFAIPQTATRSGTSRFGAWFSSVALLTIPPPPPTSPQDETASEALPPRHVYVVSADLDLMTRRLVTCDNHGRVILWTLPVEATAVPVSSFVCEDANTVRFATGRPLMMTAGSVVQIWEYGADTIRLRSTLASPESAAFTHVAADPQMRFIAAADQNLSGRRARVFLWDLESLAPLAPDQVAVLSTPVASYSHESSENFAGRVTRLEFSPGGSYLASASLDETIRVMSLRNATRVSVPPAPASSPDEPDNKLAPSATLPDELMMREPARASAGLAVPRSRRLAGRVAGMAFDPRSGLLIADDEREITASPPESERNSTMIGAVEFVPAEYSSSRLAVSSAGRWLVRGDRLWDLRSPVDGVSFVGEPPLAFAQAATGEWAATLCRGTDAPYLQLWTIDSQHGPVPTRRLIVPDDYPFGYSPAQGNLRFDRAGELLALLYAPTHNFSAKSREAKDQIRATRRLAVWTLATVASPDSPDVAPTVVSLEAPNVWDIGGNSVVWAGIGDPTLHVAHIGRRGGEQTSAATEAHEEISVAAEVSDVLISPNGQWMAAFHSLPLKSDPGRAGSQVTIWRRSENGWDVIWSSRATPLNAERNWFGRNGPAIALGNRWCIVTPRGDREPHDGVRAIHLEDAGPREYVILSRVANADIVALAMSANEQRLVIGFRDPESPENRFTLAELGVPPQEHAGAWESRGLDRFPPVWSPDANWLATSDFANVELFPLAPPQIGDTKQSRRRFRLPASAESSAAIGFSPDASALFSVTDHIINSWPTGRDALVERARRAAGRNLYENEWNTHLPEDKRFGKETFDGLGPARMKLLSESLRRPWHLRDPRDDGVILYRIARLPSIAEANDLLVDAWKAWSSFGNISPEAVSDELCHVVIRTGPIDGPGGALALSHIGPPSDERILELRFDSEEKWTPELFYATAAHELGHILGLKNSDKPGQLMSPVLDESIRVPQDEDKARFREIWKTRLSND